MIRIAAFLAAFVITALYGPAVIAGGEGGGRDITLPFNFEYSDEDEGEAKQDDIVNIVSYSGLFQRGQSGEYGHIALRLNDNVDIRGDFSTAYAYVDGQYVNVSKNPFKALTGLFSKNKDKAEEEILFGTAVIYNRNLYVMPNGGLTLDLNLDFDQGRDIEVVEDYKNYDDWGLRIRVGYNYNEINDEIRGAYKEAVDEGVTFGDVYYGRNRFRIEADEDFNFNYQD